MSDSLSDMKGVVTRRNVPMTELAKQNIAEIAKDAGVAGEDVIIALLESSHITIGMTERLGELSQIREERRLLRRDSKRQTRSDEQERQIANRGE